MVKLGYTITYVADVEKALAFFENAFGITRRFRTPENSYGELETGETTLAFASHELGKSNLSAGYISASDSDKPLWYRDSIGFRGCSKYSCECDQGWWHGTRGTKEKAPGANGLIYSLPVRDPD